MASDFQNAGNTSPVSKVHCSLNTTDARNTQIISNKKLSKCPCCSTDSGTVKKKRRKICYKDKHKIGRRKATEKVITYNESFRLYDSVLKQLRKEYQGIKKSSALLARKRKAESLQNTVIAKKTQHDEKLQVDCGQDKIPKKKKSCVLSEKEKETKSLKETIERKRKYKKNAKMKFIRIKREASLNAAAKVNLMLMEKNATDTDSLPSDCGVDVSDNKNSKVNDVIQAVNNKDSDVTSRPCDKQKLASADVKLKKSSSGNTNNSHKDKTDVNVIKAVNTVKSIKQDKKKEGKKQRKKEGKIVEKAQVKTKNSSEKTNTAGRKSRKNEICGNKSGKMDDSSVKIKNKSKKLMKKTDEKCSSGNNDKNHSQDPSESKPDMKKKKFNKKDYKVETPIKRVASLNCDAIREAVKERKIRINRRVAARTDYKHSKSTSPSEGTEVEISTANKTNGSPISRWVDGWGPVYCSAKGSYCCSSDKDCSEQYDSKATNTQDSDIVSEDARPNSAIDVMAPFMPPKSNSPCCMGNVMAQSQTHCFSPCCAHSMGIISTSQYQSFSLGTYSNLNNVQMIPYQQSGPYTSAFNVPFQNPVPHYGYYPSGFFQSSGPTGPSVLHQTNSDSCLVSHTVPIQVGPHAEVKVLINNPHSAHPLIKTNSLTVPSPDLKKDLNHCCTENEPVIAAKIKTETKGDGESPKPKRKQERRKSQKEKTPEKSTAEAIKSPLPAIKPNNHQWSWEGEPFKKLVPTVDGSPPVERKCYPSIRHEDGDHIHERDCVLLMSGPRKKDIPFVAKVSALWENDSDGEIMFSLLWYYRPEHTEGDRKPQHIDCELFASKHRDENSVACIEDKCYVLTYNEYCRYCGEVQGSKDQSFYSSRIVPEPEEGYNRVHRLPPEDCDPGVVFMCRGVYDIDRKRILKNPS